jgi:hypothetical protein
MKITSNALTTAMPAAPNRNLGQTAQMYRLRKSFAAVRFDAAEKGRILFLPEGAKIRIVSCSRLPECVEVEYKNELFHMFEADLLGPWSKPIQNGRFRPLLPMAVRACA